MRPRLDCRGELVRIFTTNEPVSPSMRPRLDCRGEPCRRFQLRRGCSAFNAATARLPWRSLLAETYQLSSGALQCGHGSIAVENLAAGLGEGQRQAFNAATARLPWRIVYHWSLSGSRHAFNAATARLPWRSSGAAPGIQCPPTFNAATARLPWRTTVWEPVFQARRDLQCGHGSIAVENRFAPLRRFPALSPSMRPRLDCRGELIHLHLLSCPGRSFNAATARLPWRICILHSPVFLETTFNAATARLPWRIVNPLTASTVALHLQCGHGSIAVEKAATTGLDTTWGEPSMRPRLDCRGEVPCRRYRP